MANFQLLAAVLLSSLAINTSVFATKINVRNGCSYAVTACDQGPGSSPNVTCYALQSGYSLERDVGASWNGGMIWGFPGDDGHNADTAQGLSAWNQANYALFNINLRGVDYYDLSNVNAYNQPLMILSNNSACGTLTCTISEKLKSFCQAPNVLSGAPGYGCLNTDGSRDYSTNGTRKFKDACPYADSFSGTEDQGLARNCTTGSNYELVICPASNQTYNSVLSNQSYIIPPSKSPPQPQTSTSPVPQSSPPTSDQTGTSPRSTATIARNVGVSISGGVVFVLTFFLVCVFIVRRRRRFVSANLQLEDEDEEYAFLETLPGLPPRFSYDDLDLATNHFSRIVGEGGFGTVYEGALPDGSKVAVKRLGASKQGQKEFRAEVATIGGINHLRLVRLWGFCSQGAHRMLVYEFLKNGSLDRWLFRDSVLEWAVRYQIAMDTAQGLCYLHRDCRHKIIHLDVKPQNILLDDQFRAKVADFGLSKLFDRELTEVETRMRGTPGYLAPEWLLQTAITAKCDVYSYGMVLLEIVSGRKNIDLSNVAVEKWYFPAWAVDRMQVQSWDEILDSRLKGRVSAEEWEQVKKVVRIAMWCIQDKPRSRPSMTEVMQMLEGSVEVKDPPLDFDFLDADSDNLCSSLNLQLECPLSSSLSQDEQAYDLGRESFCRPDSELDFTGR